MTAPPPDPALRVLVVDDEAPARRRLRVLLEAHPDVVVVAEADDGLSAVGHVEAHAPDLVLLDIRMPGLDGFGVVEALGDAMPPVVFVTAFDAHAVRAFEVRALDYLLKPVTPVRLAEALARARALRVAPARERARVQDASAAVAAAAARPVARLLARDARGAPSLVDVARIVLARAQRNYVALHGEDATWRLRGTIGALEARLDPTAFVRVNRSDIVREAAIVALEPWAHGDWRVTLSAGRSLLWSRRYRARDAARFDAVAGRLPRGRR